VGETVELGEVAERGGRGLAAALGRLARAHEGAERLDGEGAEGGEGIGICAAGGRGRGSGGLNTDTVHGKNITKTVLVVKSLFGIF
jgi:hypothetical protein